MISISAVSQNGITGIIFDGEFNEPLPFANVFVEGTEIGTTSDFDGNYEIEISPGNYTLLFSFVGYETKKVEDVQVSEDVLFSNVDVVLNPASSQLEEVVVTTTASKNNEASVLNIQKKALAVIDGISVQAMKKAGDSDIAGALKRVPGVSVEGGKYVYVRGLGDRYSKTTLGGQDLPGLDPDKNTLPLDLFPSNLIENVLVFKSASANLPADFTGGTVNINLKDFSQTPTYSVGFSVEYNPQMHFNSDFLSDSKSKTDYLARDDGMRSLGIDYEKRLPRARSSASDAHLVAEYMNEFSEKMVPHKEESFMDYTFSTSLSNRYKLSDPNKSIGYIFSLNYKSNTSFYEDAYNSTTLKTTEGIVLDKSQTVDIGSLDYNISTLGGLAYRSANSNIKFNFLEIKESTSSSLSGLFGGHDDNVFRGNGSKIIYTQRKLTSIPISGKHIYKNNLFEWKFMKNKSLIYDKDIRESLFLNEFDRYYLNPSVTGVPTRGWRYLDESGLNYSFDLSSKYDFNKTKTKLSFGYSFSEKERDLLGLNYSFYSKNLDSTILEGDANLVFADQYAYNPETDSGFFLRGGKEFTNDINSKSIVNSQYLMYDVKFSDKVKAGYGLRNEVFELYFTGQDYIGNSYNKEAMIDESKYYNSTYFIYSPNDATNLRLSFYQTTARPNFKELSTAYINDYVSGYTFLGNPDLVSSHIDNYDFRIERFGELNDFYGLSIFYKEFKNPIEIVFVSQSSPNEFKAANNESAQVKGVELEVRKSIFDNDNMRFAASLNASIIESSIKMDDVEYNSRETVAEEGQIIDRYRSLQNQSPYLVNSNISYLNKRIDLEAGFYYNVQGKTLQVVGVGGIPDAFSYPFHSLNFNATKRINDNKKITFKVKNILNENKESFYEWINTENILFSSRSIGTSFSLGYTYKF